MSILKGTSFFTPALPQLTHTYEIPSTENGGPLINQRPWPVYKMYQPDAIKFFRIGGVDYLLTANEGDSKDEDWFSEEVQVADITLSSIFGK